MENKIALGRLGVVAGKWQSYRDKIRLRIRVAITYDRMTLNLAAGDGEKGGYF